MAKSGSVGTLAGISVEISVKDFAGCPRALTELSPGKVASRRSALSRPSLMSIAAWWPRTVASPRSASTPGERPSSAVNTTTHLARSAPAMDSNRDGEDSSAWTQMARGAIAGVAARTASAPFDLLKIRLQLQPRLPVAQPPKVASGAAGSSSRILGTARDVLRMEGPLVRAPLPSRRHRSCLRTFARPFGRAMSPASTFTPSMGPYSLACMAGCSAIGGHRQV